MSVLGILSACCVLMVISKVSSSNGLQIEKRAAIVTAISSWDKKSTSKPLFSFLTTMSHIRFILPIRLTGNTRDTSFKTILKEAFHMLTLVHIFLLLLLN